MDGDKQELREWVWRALEDRGAARFPGARGRIPNFRGAEAAAERLSTSRVWRRAGCIKCNPDAPQRPVRHAALKAGRRVLMAVPKLAAEHPFVMLDPDSLGAGSLWKASSIKGASALGRPMGLDDLPRIDLIVSGCVAAGEDGARLGKGGGYSDLEFAALREAGKVHERTPIVTTVHPLQIVEAGTIPVRDHDLTLDWIVTADGMQGTDRHWSRPTGVLWDLLDQDALDAMPPLARRVPVGAPKRSRKGAAPRG